MPEALPGIYLEALKSAHNRIQRDAAKEGNDDDEDAGAARGGAGRSGAARLPCSLRSARSFLSVEC